MGWLETMGVSTEHHETFAQRLHGFKSADFAAARISELRAAMLTSVEQLGSNNLETASAIEAVIVAHQKTFRAEGTWGDLGQTMSRGGMGTKERLTTWLGLKSIRKCSGDSRGKWRDTRREHYPTIWGTTHVHLYNMTTYTMYNGYTQQQF